MFCSKQYTCKPVAGLLRFRLLTDSSCAQMVASKDYRKFIFQRHQNERKKKFKHGLGHEQIKFKTNPEKLRCVSSNRYQGPISKTLSGTTDPISSPVSLSPQSPQFTLKTDIYCGTKEVSWYPQQIHELTIFYELVKDTKQNINKHMINSNQRV